MNILPHEEAMKVLVNLKFGELSQKILVIDVETTGLDTKSDRIVELAMWNNRAQAITLRFRPDIPIPKEASDIHGITDEDVKNAPKFRELAPQIQTELTDATLIGFNSKRFDVPFLHNELLRAGQPGITLSSVLELDIYQLWSKLEPRSLQTALRTFCPQVTVKHHTAEGDITATLLVMSAILTKYQMTFEEAINLTKTHDRHDKFKIKNGHLIFNFGKFKGHYCKDQLNYCRWLLNQSFLDEEMRNKLITILEGTNNGGM